MAGILVADILAIVVDVVEEVGGGWVYSGKVSSKTRLGF